MSESASARVEVLTAEVRALMVGSRQVTLSVYRQLDEVPHDECTPFGRVRDSKDEPGVHVVGCHIDTGSLVRAHRPAPRSPHKIEFNPPIKRWCAIGSRDVVFRESNSSSYPCAQLAVEGEDEVNWYIHSYRGYGGWTPSTGEIAAQMKIYAERELAELRSTRSLYNEWVTLPLIVLAGLR